MQKVVVFGSLNMDMTIESDRMPQAGETISGSGFFLNPGGKGANQAVAAAKLGARVHMVGAVGADAFGDQMIAALADAGVSCECVARLDGYPTGVASITRIDGDNRIILDAGANHALGASEVSAALDQVAGRGDVFLTQLECDVDAVLAALADARARGMYTVINPAPARRLPREVWANVDLVCVNETECETITGIYPDTDASIRDAMDAFVAMGVDTVAITLGGRGSAMLADGRELHSVPPLHDVVDTTCAGDTYIGALVAGRAADMPIDQTIEWASCASALTTTRLGAQQAIPSAKEVEELIVSLGR